jgi:thermitase
MPARLPSCRPPSSEFIPNDPMFAQQWGLQRVGAPRGWEIMRGVPGVTVAVIDEGVELGHPDLDVHPQSWNASTDTPDGSPTGSHGTACAGIIGARLNNGQGVAGIAGGVRIMAIATATWADIDIAEGLYFAADNGARVVSMSFGVYASWNFWDFDLIRDALQYAHDQGLVLIAASGNENGNVARYANVPSKPSGTWNEEVGYGRINVERALLYACQGEVACEGDECSGCGGACVEPTRIRPLATSRPHPAP